MQYVPQHSSLVAETEKVLIEGILNRRWRDSLPGERRLCRDLQVSRWTVRAALKALAKQDLIRIEHGRPCKISRPAAKKLPARGLWRVGCIVPEPLWRLTSFTSYSLNELRVRIQKMGGQMDVYHGPKWYRPNCAGALTELINQNSLSCWMLVLSTPGMQRWFEASGLPVIVAGSLHDGVTLPSQDIHFRAVGRHAVGMFLARGHRKIALLACRLDRYGLAPGIRELERGAQEACAANRESKCDLLSIHHDNNTLDVCRAIDRLFRRTDPPTAILFAHSATLLTAITYLGQLKVRIPTDISIAVTQDEAYFPHIVPALTHYEWNPEIYATTMCRLLQQARDRTIAADACVRFMPVFVAGSTLAAAATR